MKTLQITRDRKDLERRRRRAGQMFGNGRSQYAVAKHFNVSTAAANQWHTAWQADKKDGLKSKGHPGFPSAYTPEKKKKLKRIILAGPAAHGYATDFWTVDRIRTVARKKLGITLALKRTWQTVFDLGFSVQKPDRKAKERNEKAITDWKIKTFPSL